MPLVDLQRQMRDAVVRGNSASLAPLLVGGQNASGRLAIHLRHYEASLTAAVVGRFPATGWLIGAHRLEAAARRFVHERPPTEPCIAEYGLQFPGFLGTWPETGQLTYAPEFALLDWHLGRLAVSTDVSGIGHEHLAAIDAGAIPDFNVALQSGVHYQQAGWPIDELITMYLADTTLESWTFRNEQVRLQVRGSRGAFSVSRLSEGEYTFRVALFAGRMLGDAASGALDVDPSFDPGSALLTLINEQLITSIDRPPPGGQS